MAVLEGRRQVARRGAPRHRARGRLMRVAAACLTTLGAAPAFAQQPARAPVGCVTCHAGLPEALAAPVEKFRDDVHAARGFTCVDCHGGDPAAADQALAHDPSRGYRGVPAGQAEIDTCARCHSDAAFMRRYMPRQRVDQAVEYAASVHGQRLAEGDTRVATCTSCHGTHDIRLVSDARAPVYRLNVAGTCAACHSDPARMAGYTLADGSPVPTDQFTQYTRSVHHAAMVDRHDLAAPTCNDCHGNHGAAPPGVDAVVNVCGTCHAVFQTRFEESIHAFVLERGCADCHGYHAVVSPPPDLLGTSERAVCWTCHGEGDAGFAAAGAMRANLDRLREALGDTHALIARARHAGMEMTDQELALGEARNQLTLARMEVHTFDPAIVDGAVAEGLAIVEQVEASGHAALGELRFRRRGLAVALGAILLLVVALALKIRELDRRDGVRAH